MMYDELIKRLHRYSENLVAYKLDSDFASAVREAADAIEELRGAADMRPIVTCGECRYAVKNDGAEKEKLPMYCTIHDEQFWDDDEFCSYGVRREGEN